LDPPQDDLSIQDVYCEDEPPSMKVEKKKKDKKEKKDKKDKKKKKDKDKERPRSHAQSQEPSSVSKPPIVRPSSMKKRTMEPMYAGKMLEIKMEHMSDGDKQSIRSSTKNAKRYAI
jgi:outer membrane biosynthesis protein TonB